ncbi:Proteasome subunit beta type-3 [Chionoecetes opilio]|uniref:Proteasome subunit beta type-3 n=1 Tax=Chionoecetes opilio TaxID=41210 RepID=A0A8J4XS58_CHIOP|nr:Proteasome subunit beta type-3 [Chionoecetes opilio]
MKGKNCVAIACDLRFGIQAQTISTNFKRVFELGPHLYIGLPGLATDTQTVLQRLQFRIKMYEMREGRRLKPHTLMAMVQNLLYERRFGPYFVEPVIAGLDPKTKEPYICALDLIGCGCEPADFVVSGTCSESLYALDKKHQFAPAMSLVGTPLASSTPDCLLQIQPDGKDRFQGSVPHAHIAEVGADGLCSASRAITRTSSDSAKITASSAKSRSENKILVLAEGCSTITLIYNFAQYPVHTSVEK